MAKISNPGKGVNMSKYAFLIFAALIIFPANFNPILAASCTATKPDKAPELFQIDAAKTSAKLYFTPVNNAVTQYTIIYGLERLQNDFIVSFPFGPYDGVINFTINDLSPNTKYYFRVRADNDCRQGWWSDTMSATTNSELKVYTKYKDGSKVQSNNKTSNILKVPLKTEDPLKIAPPINLVATASVNYPIARPKFVFKDFFASILVKVKSFFN